MFTCDQRHGVGHSTYRMLEQRSCTSRHPRHELLGRQVLDALQQTHNGLLHEVLHTLDNFFTTTTTYGTQAWYVCLIFQHKTQAVCRREEQKPTKELRASIRRSSVANLENPATPGTTQACEPNVFAKTFCDSNTAVDPDGRGSKALSKCAMTAVSKRATTRRSAPGALRTDMKGYRSKCDTQVCASIRLAEDFSYLPLKKPRRRVNRTLLSWFQ